MLALPFLCYTWILLSRVDLVVKSQQAMLPVSLRTGGDKRGLGVVVHQRIWERSGYTAAGNVSQPGGIPIGAWLLKVEDKEDTVIRVFVPDPIGIEDLGGELVRITRQVIEEHHRDLKPMGLHVVRP